MRLERLITLLALKEGFPNLDGAADVGLVGIHRLDGLPENFSGVDASKWFGHRGINALEHPGDHCRVEARPSGVGRVKEGRWSGGQVMKKIVGPEEVLEAGGP